MIKNFKFFKGPTGMVITSLISGRYSEPSYVSNEQQTHGFCVGIYSTQLILHYEGDMDIESVRAMTWDLQFRYANYVSINQQIIGFMEDFLNEHLSGTSIIRLA